MRVTNEMVMNKLDLVLAKLEAIEKKLGIEQIEVPAPAEPQEKDKKPKEKKPRKPRKQRVAKNPYHHEYKISTELANFMGIDYGIKHINDVMQFLTNYIKTKKLYDHKNPKNIKLDSKLKALFPLKRDEQLTYFNLKQHLKPHFTEKIPKPVPVVPDPAVQVVKDANNNENNENNNANGGDIEI